MTDEQLSKIFREYSFRENAKGEFDMDLSGFKDAIAEYDAEKAKETCKWRIAISRHQEPPYYSTGCLWLSSDIIKISKNLKREYDIKYCPHCGKRIEAVE